MLRPLGVLLAAATALLALGSLAQLFVLAGGAPPLREAAALSAGAVGASAGLAVPAALLGGWIVGLRGLADDGAWRGLGALGVPGRRLARASAGLLAGLLALHLATTHVVEPLGRGLLREVRVAALVGLEPGREGTLHLGALSLAVDGGRLHLATGDTFGSAATWALTPARASTVLELGGLVATTPELTVTARRATIPLAVRPGPRLSHAERTTPALLRVLTPGTTYERWLLHKRTLLPVALGLVLVGLVPWCLARSLHPLALGGGALAGWWLVVRLLDGAAPRLGLAATGALLLVAAALPLLGWVRWRDA